MSAPAVVVSRDATLLARSAAARLVTRLVDVQTARGSASVVLTGGGVGTAVLRELCTSPARDAVDWRRLSVWWGDERFLPAGDPERNETQARAALLDHVPLDPDRVHPMAASDGPDGNDPEAAASRYADALARAARPDDHAEVPSFDVLLLGVGPEGHVASIFPESPAAYDDRAVWPSALPQTAAHPHLVDVRVHQRRSRGLAARGGRGQVRGDRDGAVRLRPGPGAGRGGGRSGADAVVAGHRGGQPTSGRPAHPELVSRTRRG